MTAPARPARRWRERERAKDQHERLVWSVSAMMEQWRWVTGVLLLVFFAAVPE